MARPRKKRQIGFSPTATYFKPAGISLSSLNEITLGHEEIEALRLKDLVQKTQEEAACQMGISQPTFHRLVQAAHKKIIDALVHGKAIKIKGGHYTMKEKAKNPQNTILAVSSSSQDLEGEVDSRFGRCKYFLLISIENNKIVSHKALENGQIDMRGGAGIATAQMLANHNVGSIISGNIGPRAIEVLQQFQIPAYQATGSIREVVQKFINGTLTKIEK